MPEQLNNTDLAKQRLRLWLQMLKATRSTEAQLRSKLRESFDSTLPRFDVLATLDANKDGMKMSDLSEHLIVSNGNVTGVVTRLVDDGLVERTNLKGDRRAFLVKITPKGQEFINQATQEHLSWVDDIFANVTEADAARGISIMMDIREEN